jgi:rhodanese-related sulfurtransferase
MPAAIVASQLAHQVRTDPSKLVLLDIRLGWQFADWAVPGSRNLKLEDLEAAIEAAPAEAQVVLLDHDGSYAFAAAGALMARKPGRVLHALVGGVTGWYREVELGTGAPMPVPAALPAAGGQAAAPAKATKKRSAGC